MTQSIDLTSHRLVALTRESLAALRAALLRDGGPTAAAYLQEAGFAGGQKLFDSFRAWLSERGAEAPEELELEEFERYVADYFRESGWGTLSIGSIGDAVATLDSTDWAEADPEAALDAPGCSLTVGMLSAFFGLMVESKFAVLEVECRSMSAPRCRFLLGNTGVMEYVYEEMGRGASYEQAVENVG